MGFRQYLRRRQVQAVDRLVRGVIAQGWNPVEATRAAIQAECGFPPFDSETTYDYTARAADVSRAMVDAYMERRDRGERPLPEMAGLDAFMERFGRRVAGR
jgi:hypothetical protein